MSKATIKTNNDPSAYEKKIQLRLNSLERVNGGSARVLECFGGEGLLWNEVKKRSDKNIQVFSIDQKDYRKFQYKGDSLKVLPSLDLSRFQIIDLDSYGIPFSHMEVLFRKRYTGIVHITCIQSGMGNLPNGLLESVGYTQGMMKKCRTLLSKDGGGKFKSWLANNGVKKIECLTLERKNYFWFELS